MKVDVELEQRELLVAVLENAHDMVLNELAQGRTLYNEHYRPYRLAALKQDYEDACAALEMVKGWPV